MISLVSSHTRFSRTGSCASAFQKFVTLSILRVAIMSSYTARTSGLAFSYSINPRVDMGLLCLQAFLISSAGFCQWSFCLPDRDAPALPHSACMYVQCAASAYRRQSSQARHWSVVPALRVLQCNLPALAV